MKFCQIFSLNILVLNFLCSGALANNPQANAITGDISAGLEQDSNLTVVELDKSSHQSDLAVLLGIKVDGIWQANEKCKLSGSYSLFTKTYQHQSEYDLMLNQFAGDASYDAKLLTVGASYHYADANLDKNDFLNLQQNSIYIAKLINSRIYLRGATNWQDKQFAGRRERNAKNLSFAGDVFVFFNEGKTFAALGLTNENENATLHELDYKGNTMKAKLSHQYVGWNKQQKLQFGWRYVERDYTGINPDIERERYDSARITELEWEVKFTNRIAMTTNVEYSQYDSNLPSAKYSETRTSATLKARF